MIDCFIKLRGEEWAPSLCLSSMDRGKKLIALLRQRFCPLWGNVATSFQCCSCTILYPGVSHGVFLHGFASYWRDITPLFAYLDVRKFALAESLAARQSVISEWDNNGIGFGPELFCVCEQMNAKERTKWFSHRGLLLVLSFLLPGWSLCWSTSALGPWLVFLLVSCY